MSDRNSAQHIESKIEKYKQFWSIADVKRPLIGFDVGGYFPLNRFSVPAEEDEEIVPGMIKPGAYLNDYEEFLQASNSVEDDFIKGVSPIAAVPWMEAMLGCTVKRGMDSIWAQELHGEWDKLLSIQLDTANPWFAKYLEFIEILQKHFLNVCPVGQPILRGMSDLLAVLRGHSESIIGCIETPDETKELIEICKHAFLSVIEEQYKSIEPFHGGYFIEQYSLWAPDKIIRLQEDVSALLSPDILRQFIIEPNRFLASQFPCSFIHLHTSSLFLLDIFLEIEELDVIQINKDASGMEVDEIIPFFQKVQNAGKRLVIRGPITKEDMRLLSDNLSPNGLLIQTIMENPAEVADYFSAACGFWE
jgi:hypothetical protein